MTAHETRFGNGDEDESRTFQDLRRAARVLGFTKDEFQHILKAARADGKADPSDRHLVERIRKRLIREFHSR